MPDNSPLPDTTAAPGRALEDVTFAVCSNRLPLIRRHLPTNIERLNDLGAKHMVVYDGPTGPDAERTLGDLNGLGVSVIAAGEHRGLSPCRNEALDSCATSRLVFLDDEVSVDRPSMAALGSALARHDAAGVVIRGPEYGPAFPWFVRSGQLHYLGIHSPEDPNKRPWGACLGVRVDRVRRWGLRFRAELGRNQSALASGDDTEFCREIMEAGGSVILLESAHVWHNIDPGRLSLSYLLRRAYWQGRSELRRNQAVRGLRKEWRRNLRDVASNPRSAPVALAMGLSVIVGLSVEFARQHLCLPYTS